MPFKKIIYLSIILFVCLTLTSCAALELFELGSMEGALVGEELIASRMGVVALEEAVAIENTSLFNSNIQNLRFIRGAGNPTIGLLEGSETLPVAEVLLERNMFRLNNGKMYPITKEMYAVNSEQIIVRDIPSKTNFVEVDRIHKDGIIIKLSEENGFYRIRFGQYKEGYVDPLLLTFLAGKEKDRVRHQLITNPKSLQNFIVDKSSLNSPEAINVLLLVADSLTVDRNLTSSIKRILENKGYKVNTTLFSDRFIQEGYFNLFMDGNVNNFKDFHLNKYVDLICLVDKSTHYTSNQFKDMVSAKSGVNIQVISATTSFLVDSKYFSLAGAGFSNKQANEILNNHINQKMELTTFNF